MKKIFLTLVLIASYSLLSAQSGSIMGIILDSNENAVFSANVYVNVNGDLIGASTNSNGSFTIKPLADGLYDVTISSVGFQKVIITGVAVTNNTITFVDDVILRPGAYMGKPVVIKGEVDPLIKPDDPGKMIIGSTQIAKMTEPGNINKIISSINTNVYTSDDGKEIYFRGSRNSDVVYIIDGVKSINGQANVPSRGIGSIMVYSGGVPAKYGDFTGGCVVIETQSYFNWISQKRAMEKRMNENSGS